MDENKFDATKYKNDFQKEKYDRIIVTQNIGGAFYEKRTEETEGATC